MISRRAFHLLVPGALLELCLPGSAQAASAQELFTLARNRYFDEYRRRHGAVRSESLDDYIEREGDPADSGLDPSAIVNDAQVRATIRNALALLPAEQFEVVSLWMQGFALTEVAQITGAPWHTVVSRKTYALKKLKASLDSSQV